MSPDFMAFSLLLSFSEANMAQVHNDNMMNMLEVVSFSFHNSWFGQKSMFYSSYKLSGAVRAHSGEGAASLAEINVCVFAGGRKVVFRGGGK